MDSRNSQEDIEKYEQMMARWDASHFVESLQDVLETSSSCYVGIDTIRGVLARPSCDSDIVSISEIIGVPEYRKLSTSTICQLGSISRQLSNDLFIVSQLSNNELCSKHVSYECMENQTYDEFRAKIPVKTMAFEDKYDYALTSHNHDHTYSNVKYDGNPLYDNSHDKIITIANVDVSTDNDYYGLPGTQNPYQLDVKQYNVNIPVIDSSMPPKPIIGTLRIVGVGIMQQLMQQMPGYTLSSFTGGININPYSSNDKIRDTYDGWVFPNGSAIPNINNQLSDACQYFERNANGDIMLPNIFGFFKCNPHTMDYTVSDQHSQHVTLNQHVHPVDKLDFDFSNATIEFVPQETTLSSTENCSSKNAIYPHTGKKLNTNILIEVTSNFDVERVPMPDIPIKETQSENQTFKPQHVVFPVMIYLGGETAAYYENL